MLFSEKTSLSLNTSVPYELGKSGVLREPAQGNPNEEDENCKLRLQFGVKSHAPVGGDFSVRSHFPAMPGNTKGWEMGKTPTGESGAKGPLRAALSTEECTIFTIGHSSRPLALA